MKSNLVLFLLVFALGSYSQCGISYTTDTTSSTGFSMNFNFSNLGDPSKGSAEIYVYDSFGFFVDQGYASEQWPILDILLMNNGNYYFNGVVTDTLTSCQDSIFGTFTTINQPGGFNCDPRFSYSSDSLNMDWSFFPTAPYNPPSCNYIWHVGEGTTYFDDTVAHTYQSQVFTDRWIDINVQGPDCLNANAMMFDTIVSGYLFDCNASFNLFQDTSSVNNYWAYNTSYGGFISHFWDFGDGGTSTQQFPTYLYTTPGQYNLCLTVDDTSGCQSTFCDTITVVVKKLSGTTLHVLDPNSQGNLQNNDLIGFEIYPNPSSGLFSISFDSSLPSSTDFVIVDVKGVEVFRRKVLVNAGMNSFNLQTQHLNSGIYFYQFKTERGKLIIE